MLSDPLFYLTAIPAILLFGISKGGFGGGFGIVSVPLMALAVSPVQAAAIMLPILCLMDVIGLRAYAGRWNGRVVALLLPGGLLGVAAGGLVFGTADQAAIRVILGAVSVVFCLYRWLGGDRRAAAQGAVPNRVIGLVMGAAAGFTSTVAHAGGPPANIYLLALRLDKTVFVASIVVLFAAINTAKLVPYALTGSFTALSLTGSLLMAPVAALGMALGLWLHPRVKGVWFFRIIYGLVFVTGLKLLHDGARGLLG